MFVQVSSVGTKPGEIDVALGSSNLGPDGDFQVDAWARGKPENVRLAFSDERGVFHVAELALEDLSMPLGADLEAEVYEFTMEVRDAYNRPIHGAKLRVSSPNIGSNDAWNSTSTGPDGRASFLLPAGPIEYCLAKPGLQFSQGTLDWNPDEDDSPVVLTLQRLRIQDTTEGHVVDGHGLPVENALVVGGPHTRVSALASSAKVSTRTNREGNFSLRVAGNSAIELSAFQRELGQTQVLTLMGGEQGLSLQFAEDDDPKSTTIPRAKGS